MSEEGEINLFFNRLMDPPVKKKTHFILWLFVKQEIKLKQLRNNLGRITY